MAHTQKNEFVIDIDKLTYAFLPESQIPQSFKSAFERAFTRWSEVINVDFTEDHRDFAGAEIQIGFYRANCGCGTENSPVAVPGLAHAHFNRICINAEKLWAADGEDSLPPPENAFDLESVATHEIGHILGLSHSENRNSVMFKFISPRERRASLQRDDVEQVLKFYRPRIISKGKSSVTIWEFCGCFIFCIAIVFILVLPLILKWHRVNQL